MALVLLPLVMMTALGGLDGVELAQLTIQQRVVIRVPVVPMQRGTPIPFRWKEKKGPRCVATNLLGGAIVSAPDTIDLVVRGGSRVRAKLDNSCQSVDLRFGFYVRPNPDGQLCSGRDMIHARSGGQCEIERFRMLVPQR